MAHNAKFRAEALTLENLSTLLEEAAEMMGKGAQWIGFSDGSIHIWADDNGPVLYIEPATTLLHKRENAKRAK